MTVIGRNSVVMYVSDQFIEWQLHYTDYRDPSTNYGFRVGRNLNTQKERFKIAEKGKRRNLASLRNGILHAFVASTFLRKGTQVRVLASSVLFCASMCGISIVFAS